MAPNATTECPTDDTLGALVEHALDAAEATRVSAHIDTCEACRAIVVAAVRGESQTPPTVALGTPSLPKQGAIDAESLVGTRMGRYEIRSVLGSGGMGQVFAAYDAELDRSIALKILRPELARAASVLADRLVRESRLMAKVAHPSVITVYDVGREGDVVFIAMELIRGETLGAFISRVKPAWRDLLTIFERAGQGLAAAHDAGIVHRDFKPDNVLVESTGATVTKLAVTDFGIAMAAAFAEVADPAATPRTKEAKLTATGHAIGTPAYMAPEQLAGGLVDRRADVFAFCVVLWEAVFGQRPFLGKTFEEIKQAMRVRPRPPRVNIIPGRLIRLLVRGLAINPDLRWPDMRAVLRELAAVRTTQRRRWTYVGIGAAAVVGLGIAGALVLTRSTKFDPCAKPADAFAPIASRARELGGVLDAATRQKLDDNVAHWRATHGATCSASQEPAQKPTVVACLDARKLEIDAFLDDVKRDGGKAARLARVMLDPARCKDPRQGLLFARVPADPEERRKVSALRYRLVDVEQARDRQELKTALKDATALVADSKTAWAPTQAEALYMLGTVQALSGDNAAATANLRDAAALGERTHHAYVAANAWIQLIQTAEFDIEEDNRAMEYATYADAALDGIGRPPELEVLFLYFKALAMVEPGQAKEAEALLKRAIAIAETSAPQYLARAALGLGYLYEDQSRYADAVATYRRGIEQLAKSTVTTSAHTFRERLAINLALLGQAEEAERVGREAVAIADKTLSEDNADRAVVHTTLGQVLHQVGKSEAGLAEVRLGRTMFVAAIGERTERFGQILSLEGNILVEMNRAAEAVPVLARACEVIETSLGDFTSEYAECLLDQALALDTTGKSATALKLADRAIETLELTDEDPHPRTASAYVQRGLFAAAVGKQADAIADFERAIVAFEKLQLEPGHLAGAKWALGRVLWKSDKPRAKRLVEEAIALFAKASPSWGPAKADAEAWLRSDGRPPPP